MDQTVLVAAYLATVVALVLGFIFLRGRMVSDSSGEEEEAERPRRTLPQRTREPRGNRKKKGRRGLARMRNRRGDDSEPEEEDEEAARMRQERKQREKEVRQQQREAMRKAEEDKAAAKRKKADKYAAKLAAKREAREAERLQREKEEAQREKKKKEEEDQLYEQWAGEIEMEAEGTEVLDAEATESMLAAFVEHIKKFKVVVLDDLALEFEMKTKDVVDHINTMEKEGKLTGIMDDTGGKFIYITEDEMKQVADFITKKGRVGVDDIVAQSNKLIDLTGSA
mmetsp:Transcript_34465/g.83361  ORF Transcript_34465/g.83361 Transcript_34465/m.83361 type:complete len:282 (-) Transcript_34465:236-1081(-)